MAALMAGWAFPMNSNRAHYFAEDRRSLCGNWAFFGALEPGKFSDRDTCKACQKRLAKASAPSHRTGGEG